MTEIDYNVKRSSKASKPRIDVKIREVNVVLPQESDIEPEEVVQDKKEWITERKQEYDKYLEEAPERNFEPGETFLYKGNEKTLAFSETDEVKVQRNTLLAPKERQDDAEDVLRDFFRSKAEQHIQTLLKKHRDTMGVDYEGVSYRNQKTLWGSCSPKENLSFNWRLIMTPPEVMEYVVVHELAHLKERNHTNTFWRIVKEHHSEYKESAQWLEDNAPKLIFTENDL
jgi:Predicted metal-dependent hydrolase